MPSEEDSRPRAPKKRGANTPTQPVPALPERLLRWLFVGITFVLVCAAALSAPTLYSLARLIDFPKQLAWLLPASLDGYAATSIWFGRRINTAHPAYRSARRNSRLALGMTVGCNGLYHFLVLAGALVPAWMRIVLLVTVSSLPPFIVDRLLHLNALANGTGAAPESADATDAKASKATKKTATDDEKMTTADDKKRRAATAKTDDDAEKATKELTAGPTTATTANPTETDDSDDEQTPVATVTNLADRRRGDADWARIAAPYYRAYARANGGKGPSGPKLALMLKDAGHELLSNSRAREIRRATEEHLKNNPADEAERAGQVA